MKWAQVQLSALLAILYGMVGFVSSTAFAEEIVYSIQIYGSRHAIVSFTGPGSENLSITPSNNGDQIRISGVNVQFSTRENVSAKGIISSTRQVQRGAFTDLVLGFSIPISVSATPATGSLKLVVKGKQIARPTNRPGESPTPSPTSAKTELPIRLLSTYSAEAPSESGLTLVFPDTGKISPKTSVAQVLMGISYGVEILWAFVTHQPLALGAGNLNSAPSKIDPPPTKNDEELDKLVSDLTQELVELRTQLRNKDKEISELRAWKSTDR